MPRDYYDILGVSKTASADEIRTAHRKLVRKYHPDANKSSPDAASKFQEVQEAYDVLSDTEKREKYDKFGDAAFKHPTGTPYGDPFEGYGQGAPNQGYGYSEEFDPNDFQGGQFGDVFEQLFGARGPFGRGRRGGSGGGTRAQPQVDPQQMNADVEYPITLTFAQAARGTTLPVQISKGGKTETIEIKIPAGVKTGSRIRIKGRGNATPRGNGDLYIITTVSAHPYFKRDGLDIQLDLPISLYEAVDGIKLDVPTLEGPVTLTIPPGTSSGAKLRIRGKGIQRGGETGDQYCIVKVVIPKNLDPDSVRALHEIARKHPVNARADLKW